MEVLIDKHVGQSQGVGCMSVGAGALAVCLVKILTTPNHTMVHGCSYSWLLWVGLRQGWRC